ncbi:MAG: DUF4198 domain-containing protein [Chloroflexaceae bacterium]|nr:DUF4198 domain-containing protein [Chloroflexaceae bacterium]
MHRRYVAIIIVCLIMSAAPTMILAHGAHITYTTGPAISIVATYDSGEPMADAQVAVYAPDDPMTPWMTGTCDAEGRFTFIPDASISGNWEVQVRQAGHGNIITIPIQAETTTNSAAMSSGMGSTAVSGGGGYTPLQIVLMSGSIIWGLVGTALFFMRRRN